MAWRCVNSAPDSLLARQASHFVLSSSECFTHRADCPARGIGGGGWYSVIGVHEGAGRGDKRRMIPNDSTNTQGWWRFELCTGNAFTRKLLLSLFEFMSITFSIWCFTLCLLTSNKTLRLPKLAENTRNLSTYVHVHVCSYLPTGNTEAVSPML